MMLPFFLIVFAGLYYMHGNYMGRQQALLRARSCTWTYAARGCSEGAQRELLTCLTDRAGNEPDKPQQPDDDQEKQPPDVPPVTTDDIGSDSGSKILDKLANAPVIGGAILWLFGKPVAVTAKEPVHMTHNPTDQPSDVVRKGHYFTMCNTIPRDWGQVAHDVFCGFIGNFAGCP
jgi:hypothetical protein